MAGQISSSKVAHGCSETMVKKVIETVLAVQMGFLKGVGLGASGSRPFWGPRKII